MCGISWNVTPGSAMTGPAGVYQCRLAGFPELPGEKRKSGPGDFTDRLL
jgi:hypothetical protein